ncbi:MAG TPA: hypothetical protein VGE06_10395 [Flavisolibacter sp.]
MTAPNKRLRRILAAVPILLLIPLVAMQFTAEVNWDLRDFLVMGTLLSLTGLACELALRKIKETEHRLIALGGILLLSLLVWSELATSYFRTQLQGNLSLEITLLMPSLVNQ